MDSSPQVYLYGITGEVKFDENGRRNGIHLEILNLRNNSFEKVILYMSDSNDELILSCLNFELFLFFELYLFQ